MSKRTLLFIALAAFLLCILVGAVMMVASPQWSLFGDPVYTDVIPKDRPKRLDRRLLERYAGTPIEDILAEMKARPEFAPATPPPAHPAILEMLPNAPLPYPAGAVPADEAAIKEFVTTMKSEAESGDSTRDERWQFNLALASLGVKSADVPEAIRMETEPTPESDTYPVRLQQRPSNLHGPLTLGNFDGEPGLEIVAHGGSKLFKIEANGSLVALPGLDSIEPGEHLYAADFDGDGDLDLYLTRPKGLPDSLLENDGQGNFTDVTIARGLLAFSDTTAAAWIDYDQDGLLDLLVGSRNHPLELYRQTSTGLFQPVAWDLQLWVPRGIKMILCEDVNADGYPDILLIGDGVRHRLLLSKPSAAWDDWRFEEIPLNFGFAATTEISSATFFKADNDSLPDLLLTTATPDPSIGSVRLLRNDGDGQFTDVTEISGLLLEDGVLSATAIDLDLDGYPDLVLGTTGLALDRVFANQGGTGFQEISVVSRGAYLDETLSYHSADLEENGSPDLLSVNPSGVVRWLEASGTDNAWLRLVVPGQPAGTRVVVSARDRDWVARRFENTLGVEPVLTLGLGEAKTIERIEVFAAGADDALFTLDEKLEPNQVLSLSVPPRPQPRAAVPIIETGAGES